MNEQLPKWTLWAISDADEPGDAILTGMRHRDFDGVTLVLWPDADGWLCTYTMDQPARPLLLFFRGGDVEVEDALAWLAEVGLDDLCGPTAPLPTTFEAYEGRSEASRTIETHLNFPPYPWIEEARLGMEMGRYFDRVELADWTEPTEKRTGTHTFRFYKSGDETEDDTHVVEIDTDDLPF